MDDTLDLAVRLTAAVDFPSIKAELAGITHRLRHPMADILAKVPGDSLSERARAINVSRQTMYVWAKEKFRPNYEQAKTIEKLTGIPAAHIRADGHLRTDDGSENPRRKTRRRMAKGSKGASKRAGRMPSGRRGVVAKQGRSGSLRKVRQRP